MRVHVILYVVDYVAIPQQVDAVFIPDDTYYTLNIAAHMAKGFGPSVDGVHLTNGFQPLVTLFQMPAFYLGLSKSEVVLYSVLLSACFAALGTIPFTAIVLSLSNTRIATLAALAWMSAPMVLQNDLNGLDTSLAGALGLLALWLTILGGEQREQRYSRWLGVICGAVLLARIDYCFLVLIIGVVIFYRWGWRQYLIVATCALLTVLPWWAYSLYHFQSLIPVSGQAMKAIADFNHVPNSVLLTSSLTVLTTGLFQVPWFTLPLPTVALLTQLGLFIYIIWQGCLRLTQYHTLLLLPAVLFIGFYSAYLPILWFLPRYFYFVFAIIYLLLGLSLYRSPQASPPVFSIALYSLIMLTHGLALFAYFHHDESLIHLKLANPKAYGTNALKLLLSLPDGSTLASSQSGALAYYAPQGIRVINLDGVVNKDATLALSQQRIGEYMKQEGVDYYCDWEIAQAYLKSHGGKNFFTHCLIKQETFDAQDTYHFVLYRVKNSPECQANTIKK